MSLLFIKVYATMAGYTRFFTPLSSFFDLIEMRIIDKPVFSPFLI
jgi:hypothetical protein